MKVVVTSLVANFIYLMIFLSYKFPKMLARLRKTFVFLFIGTSSLLQHYANFIDTYKGIFVHVLPDPIIFFISNSKSSEEKHIP